MWLFVRCTSLEHGHIDEEIYGGIRVYFYLFRLLNNQKTKRKQIEWGGGLRRFIYVWRSSVIGALRNLCSFSFLSFYRLLYVFGLFPLRFMHMWVRERRLSSDRIMIGRTELYKMNISTSCVCLFFVFFIHNHNTIVYIRREWFIHKFLKSFLWTLKVFFWIFLVKVKMIDRRSPSINHKHH